MTSLATHITGCNQTLAEIGQTLSEKARNWLKHPEIVQISGERVENAGPGEPVPLLLRGDCSPVGPESESIPE